MSKRALLADIFTALNMLCGFLAVLAMTHNSFDASIWLIFAAAIFDGLDGKVARVTHTESSFGLQLDSLSDVVSFGIAPSILVYKLQLQSLGAFGTLLSFSPLLCSAIRLARYNLAGMAKPAKMYVGMPAPMSTLTICSFTYLNDILPEAINDYRLLAPFVVIVSALMICKIPYYKVPRLSLRDGLENSVNLIIFSGGLLFIPLIPEIVFFPLMMVYVLSGPIYWIIARAKQDISGQ